MNNTDKKPALGDYIFVKSSLTHQHLRGKVILVEGDIIHYAPLVMCMDGGRISLPLPVVDVHASTDDKEINLSRVYRCVPTFKEAFYICAELARIKTRTSMQNDLHDLVFRGAHSFDTKSAMDAIYEKTKPYASFQEFEALYESQYLPLINQLVKHLEASSTGAGAEFELNASFNLISA